jgi:ribosome-binding protein aMBF1 (putative translation factor)
MKTRNFEALAREILTEEQIQESKQRVQRELEIMKTISEQIKLAMEKEHIGFNELARKLNTSSTQVNRILKGSANLTFSSLLKVCSILKIKPIIKFQKI